MSYLSAILLCPPLDQLKQMPYPLILSPRSFRGKQEAGGIESLRRSLLKNLVTIDSTCLDEEITWKATIERLKQCLEHLWDSREWSFMKNEEGNESKEHLLASALKEIESRQITCVKQNNTMIEIKDDAPGIRLCPVIIVDPVNFFFDHHDSRFAVAELFESFRTLKWPLIMTLEDGDENFSESHRQLLSHVEFEADVILKLAVSREKYVRRTIEVVKNRNSQPQYGPHLYRIERPLYSLWNIHSSWGDLPVEWTHIEREDINKKNISVPQPPTTGTWLRKNTEKENPGLLNEKGNHPGFLIFPSIHHQLTRTRHRSHPESEYKSGIEELDKILGNARNKKKNGEKKEGLPPDAFILVYGKKGGHKLTFAFNILVAGLWNRRLESKLDKKGKNPIDRKPTSNSVMLVSFGEETRIQVDQIALSDDNDLKISEILTEKSPESGNVGDKIMLHEWRWKKNEKEKKEEGETRLIEVTFEPGYLSVEEFFWTLESLEHHFQPSRMLIDNTAHLRMRFPELHKEEMLFPALISFAQFHEMICIVIDVESEDEGGDKFISHGLKASADYLVNLTLMKPKKQFALTKAMAVARHEKVIGDWAEMKVSNVRGKTYDNKLCGVFISDISKDEHEHLNRLKVEPMLELEEKLPPEEQF